MENTFKIKKLFILAIVFVNIPKGIAQNNTDGTTSSTFTINSTANSFFSFLKIKGNTNNTSWNDGEIPVNDVYITNYGSVRFGIRNNSKIVNEYTLDNADFLSININKLDTDYVGNVGIGTNHPQEKLHVMGNVAVNGNIKVTNVDVDGNIKVNNNLHILGKVAVNGNIKVTNVDVDGNVKVNNNLRMGGTGIFTVDSPDNVGSRMSILTNGNVGIGTDSPSDKLQVTGTGRFKGLKVDAANSLEFGFGVSGKQADAGKICYGCFDGGATLNIVGAGTTAQNRKVRIWNEGGLATSGAVTIGTNIFASNSMLSVNGKVTALDYAVVSSITADYVFEADYKLKTLSETEAYIKENKHLPAFKSSKYYEANGYTITEMNIALEQTVEEMTLHAIAQEKKIEKLTADIEAIKELLRSKK